MQSPSSPRIQDQAEIDLWPAPSYNSICKEFAVFDIIGILVFVILFALCKTQERVLDEERDFWIKARQVFDQLDHSKS